MQTRPNGFRSRDALGTLPGVRQVGYDAQIVETNAQVAKRVFAEIADSFPHLMCELAEDANGAIAVSAEFPQQPSLRFPIYLNLQDDELYLNAGGSFCVAWFPCTEADVVCRFKEAVIGLLSGNARIREHHRGGRAVKSELQVCERGNWRTIATSSTLHLPLPWAKTYLILQNPETKPSEIP